jgi:hypothetical protein
MNSGSLSYPGLPPSVGNKVQLDNAGGPPNATGADAARLYFGTVNKTDAPTLYYSYILNVPASNATASPFFAGFDNSTNTTYNQFASTYVQKDAGDATKFDLGIGFAGNRNFTGPLTPGTTLFVVGSYTFQGIANLDVFADPTAVPTAEPGTHTVSSPGVDASTNSTISNFFVRGNNGEMQGIQIDEVRIGTTWADVAAKGYYWDINGANPAANGATPSGTWDGVATNFNSDPSGGRVRWSQQPPAATPCSSLPAPTPPAATPSPSPARRRRGRSTSRMATSPSPAGRSRSGVSTSHRARARPSPRPSTAPRRPGAISKSGDGKHHVQRGQHLRGWNDAQRGRAGDRG